MYSFGNITAHGQLYLYPDKPPSNLVWVDPKGHTNYWCSVQGDQSGSSSSPRTESRQTLPDSSESYNWQANGDEFHVMHGVVRVEVAPSSGKVIVGQIHAHKAPNPFLMVTWWNGVARIDLRTTPLGNASKLLFVPCAIGESFEYYLECYDGELHIYINDIYTNVSVDPKWNEYPFYFKAGAYVIDNAGPESEGGWVVYEQFNAYKGELE